MKRVEDNLEEYADPALYDYEHKDMESLLAHCDFIILERYGDWDFSPLTNESNYMIYLCKATGNLA